MVREIAVFRTREGQADASVEAYAGVANILKDAEGNRGASLYRGIEDPGSFTLIAERDSVDANTVLTQRPEFGGFGAAIAPHVAGQPEARPVEAVG